MDALQRTLIALPTIFMMPASEPAVKIQAEDEIAAATRSDGVRQLVGLERVTNRPVRSGPSRREKTSRDASRSYSAGRRRGAPDTRPRSSDAR